ncbi:hypothetical protein FA95DRAFT_537946 [Auriscalpium vulgare]|uniref:Uncharacterized protein n=1 Tax=Auriscalpium vulgare TaxID=40419 RepID=A0ACB8RFP3_9AGAM|nr:hypothetical protein FA95DRAFT_537946 [Auriscalpium vulgare]
MPYILRRSIIALTSSLLSFHKLPLSRARVTGYVSTSIHYLLAAFQATPPLTYVAVRPRTHAHHEIEKRGTSRFHAQNAPSISATSLRGSVRTIAIAAMYDDSTARAEPCRACLRSVPFAPSSNFRAATREPSCSLAPRSKRGLHGWR